MGSGPVTPGNPTTLTIDTSPAFVTSIKVPSPSMPVKGADIQSATLLELNNTGWLKLRTPDWIGGSTLYCMGPVTYYAAGNGSVNWSIPSTFALPVEIVATSFLNATLAVGAPSGISMGSAVTTLGGTGTIDVYSGSSISLRAGAQLLLSGSQMQVTNGAILGSGTSISLSSGTISLTSGVSVSTSGGTVTVGRDTYTTFNGPIKHADNGYEVPRIATGPTGSTGIAAASYDTLYTPTGMTGSAITWSLGTPYDSASGGVISSYSFEIVQSVSPNANTQGATINVVDSTNSNAALVTFAASGPAPAQIAFLRWNGVHWRAFFCNGNN